MTECQSEFTESQDFLTLIENTLLRILKSSDAVLDHTMIVKIQQKVQKIDDHDKLVQSLEFFIFSLISEIQKLQSETKGDKETNRSCDTGTDYQNLEKAIQKSEEEIRKHIRLQQQLKIYMDGLEEQIEGLEKQLTMEKIKYEQLFENSRAIENQRKELVKKVKALQHKYKPTYETKNPSHKGSKLITEPISHNFASYKAFQKRPSKNKIGLQRSQDQKLKISREKLHKNIYNPINVSMGASPRELKRREAEEETKQMIQTVMLKGNPKKNSRKILKYQTEERSLVKKELRSNSVCN